MEQAGSRDQYLESRFAGLVAEELHAQERTERAAKQYQYP